MSGKGAFVERIDLGKVAHVLKKHGRLHDLGKAGSLRSEQRADVREDLFGLGFDGGGFDFPGRGIDGDLAGAEEERACPHGL